MQNNGAPAGQVVFHVHFHIFPREKGDGEESALKPFLSCLTKEIRRSRDAFSPKAHDTCTLGYDVLATVDANSGRRLQG